jgi:hypothetical protein
VQIENFQEDGGINLSSQEYPHMHDKFEMIPEETKKLYSISRRHLLAIARESGRESHFQH